MLQGEMGKDTRRNGKRYKEKWEKIQRLSLPGPAAVSPAD
jgi:hypothetical protein